MFDYTNLHDVFPPGASHPYDKKRQQGIEANRKSLDGALFIDRVLKALGIQKAKFYPPKSESALRQFHQQICEASMSLHYKYALFFYVLLDYEQSSSVRTAADNFASASGMPSNYQIFMRGLWHMDSSEFSKALTYIAHPSLIPDFADDILTTLVRHAPEDDYSLPLAYFHTVRPILQTSTAIELLLEAMTCTSVTEALLHSRTFPIYTRQGLFTQMAAISLESAAATELAFLPFDDDEERWFETLVENGEGRNISSAKETLAIRRMAFSKGDNLTSNAVNGSRVGFP